jgi:glycosyltransferase involved in cell wall biosynthesis
MRIAIVTNTSWNIYNFRMGLIRLLIQKGHEVITIAPVDQYSETLARETRFFPVKMKQKGTNPLSDLTIITQLLKIYQTEQPDCILHFTIKPNIYGAIASSIAGIPCINTVSGLGTIFLHDGLVSAIAKKLYRFAFRFPRNVIFQNNDDRLLFISLGLVDSSKALLFPGSGVNIEKFKPGPVRKNHEFVFLLVARLLKDKGINEYAEAARLIKTKHRNVKFLLAGAPEEDPALGISMKSVKYWEKEGLITYLGFQEDIPALLRKADCIVLPSYREGTPKSLLEGAATGRPLLASDVPGCREVVTEGYNGFLFPAKDPAGLAGKMEKMLLLPSPELDKMGKNSRSLIENQFSEEIVTHKYLNLLENLKVKSRLH